MKCSLLLALGTHRRNVTTTVLGSSPLESPAGAALGGRPEGEASSRDVDGDEAASNLRLFCSQLRH